MRLFSAVTFLLLLVSPAFAAADNARLIAARANVRRLQVLVEAGAAAPMQLAQAKDELADAEDDAIVGDGLRQRDLTQQQAEEMVAAATHLLERRRQAYEKAQKMVDAGFATKASLAPLAEELDFAVKEKDLVEEIATVTRQLAAMAQAEAALSRVPNSPAAPGVARDGVAESFEGDGRFTRETLARVESAFQNRFGKPLPISAMGETAVHRALGFDHTGRVDVALNPDEPAGVWLREYLGQHQIPYFAFREAVPGKATGAHIHIGPQSTRLARGAVTASGAE